MHEVILWVDDNPGNNIVPKEVLNALQTTLGCTSPFFIFASGGGAPRHVTQALARGAQGSTSNPFELVEMVGKALHKRA
jgi:hypothetical protein